MSLHTCTYMYSCIPVCYYIRCTICTCTCMSPHYWYAPVHVCQTGQEWIHRLKTQRMHANLEITNPSLKLLSCEFIILVLLFQLTITKIIVCCYVVAMFIAPE